jgi:hypothetical protein
VTTKRRRLIADALGRNSRKILEIDVGYDFEVAIVDDEWPWIPTYAGIYGRYVTSAGWFVHSLADAGERV